MLKIYTLYSDSHSEFFDEYFLPSFQNNGLEVHATKITQSGSGEFMATWFMESTLKKVDIIIQTIQGNYNALLVFSDVDIVCFRDFSSDIISHMGASRADILFQAEDNLGTGINTGFFVCRANEKTLKLWIMCREELQRSILEHSNTNEQYVVQKILQEQPGIVQYWLLPRDKYYIPRQVGSCPEKHPPIPNNICIYHAAWVVGIHNKKMILSYAQKIVRGKQTISPLRYLLITVAKHILDRLRKFLKAEG